MAMTVQFSSVFSHVHSPKLNEQYWSRGNFDSVSKENVFSYEPRQKVSQLGE